MCSSDLTDKGKNVPKPTPSPGAEEEETLGQRRARLQAEAAARGDTLAPARPGLRPSFSMADVLSANPIDVHNQARKVSDQQLLSHLPQGSLLAQNVVAEERKKTERMNANMRASSYGSFDPLVRARQDKIDEDQPLALKIQAYKNKMAGVAGPQPGMMYNPMASSMSLADQQRQSMMMGMNMMPQPNGMMQQQQMMMPMNMNMGMMQPQMGMQMPMNNMGMMMNMPMGMQMNGMQMPMGMNGMGMMMPPMDPRQRDNIDRWMQGIQH